MFYVSKYASFIHKTASGCYSMKNEYVLSVERKALDGMLVWCDIIYPNDYHDHILRMINQYNPNINLTNLSFS